MVEEDLIKALKEQVIAGAVLDVFYEEPLKEESELWKLPNVLMTPHCADITTDYYERTMDIFMENLERFVKGEELKNVVKVSHGY